MNSDSCRKDLDSKLASKGYVHPTTNNTSSSPYMAYSDENKGDYFSQNFDPYATFNSNQLIKEVQKTDFCPVCNFKAMYSCNCPLSDMMCKNGHIWFVQKNGSTHIGDPHENE
jgi:hypothetical protein